MGESVAHRRAAHAELLCEVTLCRQLLARDELAEGDRGDDPVGDQACRGPPRSRGNDAEQRLALPLACGIHDAEHMARTSSTDATLRDHSFSYLLMPPLRPLTS